MQQAWDSDDRRIVAPRYQLSSLFVVGTSGTKRDTKPLINASIYFMQRQQRGAEQAGCNLPPAVSKHLQAEEWGLKSAVFNVFREAKQYTRHLMTKKK